MMFNKFKSEIILSWFSFALKFIGFGILLPMIFINYSVNEINVWLLIMSISTITGFLDLGVAPNFTRILSYFNFKKNQNNYINYDFLKNKFYNTSTFNELSISFQNVCFILNKTYRVLGYLSIFIVSVIYSFYYFYSNAVNFQDLNTKICFLSLAIGSFFMVKTGEYTIIMMSKQAIKKLRIIELLSSLIILLATFIIYYKFHPPLFVIIVLTNLQYILIYYILKFENRDIEITCSNSSKHLLKNLIQNSIFTTIGIFLSQTILLGTGLYLSFFENVNTSASINFTIRIFVLVSTFSNFIFYNKLPFLASIYIENDMPKLFNRGSSFIFNTLFTYSLCTFILLFFANDILILIKSNVALVERNLLFFFYLIFICERFGALNIQMFSLSNIVKIHFTNGGTFIIIFISLIILHSFSVNNYFIFSLMIGYCLFYLPVSFMLLFNLYSYSINKYYLKIYILIFFFITIFSLIIYV